MEKDEKSLYLEKRANPKKKAFIICSLVLMVILLGAGISVIVHEIKQLQKNNLGEISIKLSNSGAYVCLDNGEYSKEVEKSLELTNVKIGERQTIKFSFNLKDVTKDQEYQTIYSIDENGKEISNKEPIVSGVYFRVFVSGEVYSINNNERELNSNHTQKLKSVISSSPTPMNWWSKDKTNNCYTFKGSNNNANGMLIVQGDNFFTTKDIVLHFDKTIVDGSWYDEIIKLNFKFQAIDYRDNDANLW